MPLASGGSRRRAEPARVVSFCPRGDRDPYLARSNIGAVALATANAHVSRLRRARRLGLRSDDVAPVLAQPVLDALGIVPFPGMEARGEVLQERRQKGGRHAFAPEQVTQPAQRVAAEEL